MIEKDSSDWENISLYGKNICDTNYDLHHPETEFHFSVQTNLNVIFRLHVNVGILINLVKKCLEKSYCTH